MAKKSFTTDLSPALAFISNTEAITAAEPGQEPTRFIFNTPERETKSRRVQLLIKPTVYDGIKEMAAGAGASVNAYINAILEDFLKREGPAHD